MGIKTLSNLICALLFLTVFRAIACEYVIHNLSSLNTNSQGKIIRIYSGTTSPTFRGMGVIVDVDKGWVLTANHVVEGLPINDLYIRVINHADDFELSSFIPIKKVIDSAPPSVDDIVSDIALLQVDGLSSIIDEDGFQAKAYDISMNSISNNENAFYVKGTFDDPTFKIVDNVNINLIRTVSGTFEKCKIKVSAATAYGNSGGPIISKKGFLLGLMIVKAEDGNVGHALSASCIAPWLQDKYTRYGEEVWRYLVNEKLQLIEGSLNLQKRSSKKFLNTELNAALEYLKSNFVGNQLDDSVLKIDSDRFYCPIYPALVERGLFKSYSNSYKALLATISEEDIKDRELRQKERVNVENLAKIARTTESINTPETNDLIAESNRYILKQDLKLLEQLAHGGESQKRHLDVISQGYLKIADANIRTGGSTQQTQRFEEAIELAATSIVYARKEVTYGGAMAALGTSALKLEKFDLAVWAFHKAYLYGNTPDWVNDSYNLAFSKLLNKVDFISDPRYMLISKERFDDEKFMKIVTDIFESSEYLTEAPVRVNFN